MELAEIVWATGPRLEGKVCRIVSYQQSRTKLRMNMEIKTGLKITVTIHVTKVIVLVKEAPGSFRFSLLILYNDLICCDLRK